MEPDTSNPFDYRNHLSAFYSAPAPRGAETRPGSHPPSSAQSTPLARLRKPAANPMLPNQRGKQSRQSTTAAGLPASKQQKPSAPTPVVAGRASVPEVRVSSSTAPATARPTGPKPRKQLVEDIQLDADEDLLLDDDERPAYPANGVKQRSLAHLGTLESDAAGPRSLRSAASSPGSRFGSPAVGSAREVARRDADGDELMVDGEEEEEEERRPRESHKGQELDEEGQDDDDGDVEDLALPAPARDQGVPTPGTAGAARRRSSTYDRAGGVADGDGDEDDELEQEMLRAMQESDDDGGAPVAVRPAEEEEESEEE